MTNSHADFMNLPTHWSAIQKAGEAGSREWSALLEYYLPAVRAYLMGCTKDVDRTDELVQKFSLHFLSAGFRMATPEKGPFRHYLKRSLSNLVRKDGAAQKQHEPLPDMLPDDKGVAEHTEDQEFLQELIRTMLDCSWADLRKEQSNTGTPYFDILKCCADSPNTSKDELAKKFSRQSGQEYTNERFRKILSRGRHKFSTHLYEQVAATMDKPTPDDVAQELADLGLLPHCSLIVEQRRHATGSRTLLG